MTNGQTMVLEFGFDGFRMVSLAARRQLRLHMPTGHGGNDNSSLKHSAIWYPDVPPPTVNLNEDFLVASEMYMSGYRPLFWSWFGGRGGIYLASLVKIRIIGFIGRIDFFFDTPEVPTGCRSFGRIEDSEDREDEDDEAVEFPIDGPGGEVIDRVEIRQGLFLEGAAEWLRREGYLTWLKLHTNRGRTCEVGRTPTSRKMSVAEKEISAAPGTVITGFYGVQYRYLGFHLMSLGVITEPLRKT
ncbi:hypothetical protein VTK56DRAFT_7501 [Thermocarpiscus australiensis]